jgi:hypothetical protein
MNKRNSNIANQHLRALMATTTVRIYSSVVINAGDEYQQPINTGRRRGEAVSGASIGEEEGPDTEFFCILLGGGA